MSGKEERSEDLKGLEAALAALVPRVEGFDRERLIFEAGRASALAEMERNAPSPLAPLPKGEGTNERPTPLPEGEGRNKPRRRWAWPAAFSAMTAVAATLLVMLMTRPGPQVAERTVEPSGPAPAGVLPAKPPTEVPSPAASVVDDRRMMQQRAMMHGIDLWAEPVVPRSSGTEMARAPSSVLQLERELMEESAPGGRMGPARAPQWLSPFGDRT